MQVNFQPKFSFQWKQGLKLVQSVAFIHLPLSNKQDNKVNIWTIKRSVI